MIENLEAQGYRFNGATTLRSWKLFTNKKTTPETIQLQWSHDLAVVETRPRGAAGPSRRSFNGATTLRSWKREEPSRLGLMNVGFNGATTLRSWKLHAYSDPRLAILLLQWSHDLAVVETASPLSDGGTQCTRLQWSHDLAVVET